MGSENSPGPNAFGVALLLASTSPDTVPTPTSTATPAYTLDHFRGYRVAPTPPFTDPNVSLQDQFDLTPQTALVGLAERFLPPVQKLSLTGPSPAPSSTPTDGSGNYALSGLSAGGTYTVTPTKTAHIPGSAGISTVDVIAAQRHFLVIGTPLSGCRLAAADVNGVGGINTVDVIAIQRFFLGLSTGIANTGKYQFTPASITYTGISGNQTGQNYSALLFGDVATPFVPRPGGPSQNAASKR